MADETQAQVEWSDFAKRVIAKMEQTEFIRSIEEWEYPNGNIGIFRVKDDEHPTGQAVLAVIQPKELEARETFWASNFDVWREGAATQLGRMMAIVSGVTPYTERFMEGITMWAREPDADDENFQELLQGTL